MVVVLLFIFLGVCKGGFGIVYVGGVGVIVLGLFGCKVDLGIGILWDVIGVIILVIFCVVVMEVVGGLELLVMFSEWILWYNLKRIIFLVFIVMFFMIVLCGIGYVVFVIFFVIVEVVKE